MAGRFVFQKFASGMSRSKSRLSAHASASAMANPPVIPRASETGTRTPRDVFHGAAVHPVMYARCLSIFLRSSAAAKTGWSTAGLPSSVIIQKKSAFVDSVGVKRTCSSGASNKLEHSQEAKIAYWRTMFSWLGPNKVVGVKDLGFFLRNVVFLTAIGTACLAPGPGTARHCSSCNCFSGPSQS